MISDEKKYDFRGSNIVMLLVILTINLLWYFKIIKLSWFIVFPMSLLVAAVVASLISLVFFSRYEYNRKEEKSTLHFNEYGYDKRKKTNTLRILLPILGPLAAIFAFELSGIVAMIAVLWIALILFFLMGRRN